MEDISNFLDDNINFYLVVCFSVFIISIVGTKLVILALRNKITSPDIALITGKRKASIPDNAGIAMVFAIIIGFAMVEADYSIIGSIFILAGIPLLNNLMPISDMIKALVQLIVIVFAVQFLPKPIFSNFIPPIIDEYVAIALWLWIVYSFDKLEVVEGLIPVEMVSIGFGIGLLSILYGNFFSPLVIQSLIFAAAGIGFFWWNHYPANALMGKIGKIPAGFVAGYLLLLAANQGYIAAALILPAYFLADSAVTFLREPVTKKLSFKQNGVHLPPYCLRAVRNSNSPLWIVRSIAGVNMLLVFLEAQTLISTQMMFINLFLAYATVFALIWFFGRVKNKTIEYDTLR